MYLPRLWRRCGEGFFHSWGPGEWHGDFNPATYVKCARCGVRSYAGGSR
jgi:ribosomal protein L37E